MSLNNFIPVVWSAKLQMALLNAHVFAARCNRDFEGDIRSAGDTVKVNTIGRVTIGSYTKNTDIAAAENLTGAQLMLTVDQQKYFNFQIDDIDKTQQSPKLMSAFMGQAGWELADVEDTFVAALMITDTSAANVVTGATVGIGASDTNLYNTVVDLGVKLDEANIPSQGRWVVLPPWAKGLLLKDDRFIRYGTAPQDARLRTGEIGEIDNFTVFISNNVQQADATHWYLQAGTSEATAFADQIMEVEGYRPQLRFGDAMKGLHVYGAKVFRPQALAYCSVAKGTLS